VPPITVCGAQVERAEEVKQERESIRIMKYLLRLWEIENPLRDTLGQRRKEGRKGKQLNGIGSVWHGGYLGVWKEEH
jgi:hypothetical protein